MRETIVTSIPCDDGADRLVHRTARPRPQYAVTPMLVRDRVSQCGAYFLLWFSSSSLAHIQEVVDCDPGSGGLSDEVEFWLSQCEDDLEGHDWLVEDRGPWVFHGISPESVAEAIRHHSSGWSAEDYEAYGKTWQIAPGAPGHLAEG